GERLVPRRPRQEGEILVPVIQQLPRAAKPFAARVACEEGPAIELRLASRPASYRAQGHAGDRMQLRDAAVLTIESEDPHDVSRNGRHVTASELPVLRILRVVVGDAVLQIGPPAHPELIRAFR